MQRPTKLDKKLARELKGLSDPANDPYDTVIGKTMCANDFYEGEKMITFVSLCFLTDSQTEAEH